MSLIATITKQVGNFGSLVTDAIDSSGGKLAVAWIGAYTENTANVLGLSDSKSNTWTKLTQRNTGIGGDPYQAAMFYCINPTVGSGHTFTGTGHTNGTLIVAIFNDTISAYDAESGGVAGSGTTSIQPGSITPAEAGELFVTGITNDNGSAVSINSSFTEIDDETSTVGTGAALAYKKQTGGAAAENPTWTVPAQGGRGIAVEMAAFKVTAPTILISSLNDVNAASIGQVNNVPIASVGELNNVSV